jgi:hypothetical protein
VGVIAFNLAGRFLPVFESSAHEDHERATLWEREAARQRHALGQVETAPAAPHVVDRGI